MPAEWYQVVCTVPAQFTETVADFLAELSGCGVCTENREVDTFSVNDIPDTVDYDITAYFALPCQIEEQLSIINNFLSELTDQSIKHVKYSLLGEESWSESWKLHFRPLEIGRRLLIIPSWEEYLNDDKRLKIVLDPGMAFGTGGHETTRLCLECLDNLLPTFASEAGSLRVLDLGTGSGILAIAAVKLGAGHLDAVDIDPQAVFIATENCRLNGVSSQVVCSTTPLEQLNDRYGIIIANIIAEELVRLAPKIVNRLETGGCLILSGILEEREQYVLEGFGRFPLILERSLAAGDWRCLLYRSRL